MTRSDRLKLASAARELASEYAEGWGPKLIPDSWCGCAAGRVYERAGLSNAPNYGARFEMPAMELEAETDSLLSVATQEECGAWGDGPLPGAVVFPLLAVADELEAAK